MTYAISDLDALRTIEEYASYQSNVRARIQELDAQYAGKAFDPDAQTEWAELDEIEKRTVDVMTELQARINRVRSLSGDQTRIERTSPERAGASVRGRHVPDDIYALEHYRSLSGSESELEQALIDGAKKAIELAVYPHERADQHAVKEDLLKLFATIDDPQKLSRHILATAPPLYGAAWAKTAVGRSLQADETRKLEYVAAMSLSDSAGGYLAPFQLDPTIILTSDGSVNPLRQLARVERITGKQWEGVTSAGVTASYGAEASPAPDTSTAPVLVQPALGTVEAKVFVPYSRSLEASVGALQAQLASIMTDAKDQLEADKFINGTGSDQPFGVVQTLAGSSIIWTQAAGAFGVPSDVFALETDTATGVGGNGLPPRFRPGASIIGNKSIYNYIRQASVGTVGEGTIWVRGVGPGMPSELIGYPAYEASEMDATIVDGNDILLIGQFRNFIIVDRIGFGVEYIQHLFDQATGRPTGQRGAFGIWANNSKILVDNAFRVLRVGEGS